MAWAYFCWRDGGGLVTSTFPPTAGLAVCCGCRIFGGLAAAGQNDRGGLPRRNYGGFLTGDQICDATIQDIVEKVYAKEKEYYDKTNTKTISLTRGDWGRIKAPSFVKTAVPKFSEPVQAWNVLFVAHGFAPGGRVTSSYFVFSGLCFCHRQTRIAHNYMLHWKWYAQDISRSEKHMDILVSGL
ncbi:hypothetical protein NDU88_001889 [Pleurodeles waltl]|uniref:Uncharacterized protein n=1 Tax=Pleurodeles waltl TaxID=8319 RepID=A0AAV7R9A9_PLEWA|nr:hypothetical protein NDU88_001889 [Pleurodeles waltl]